MRKIISLWKIIGYKFDYKLKFLKQKLLQQKKKEKRKRKT